MILKETALTSVLNRLKNLFSLKSKTVFSVNGEEPVNGDVTLREVPLAVNLSSDKTHESLGEFIIRTSGGSASISDGDAFALRILGNRVHTGYVPESLMMTVNAETRPAPAAITASLDEATFEEYVGVAGTYELDYLDGWSATPSLYGVTVSNTPVNGDKITIVWDGENDAVLTVTVVGRTAPPAITATLDRATFVGYVDASGTITLTYTTEWSANPALYGITVTGTPVDGDEIVVVYVKENRGTITVANPTALKSTGWNLYNHTAGYAYATKYSDNYGFMIGGTYTAVKFATTPNAVEKTTITPVDGMFSIPSDGYIFVEGGNNTDTFIINVWSDWTDGPVGTFEAYSETEINLATIMQTYFANGLLRIGDVRDEINLNTATAISRINRMAYSTANLATAKASGRAYEYDTNYIYIVKAVFDVNSITLDGSYTASDHGNEFFTGTTIPVFIETLYGNNLKNKLERDVVTKSHDIVNNLTTDDATKTLSAAMGKELNSKTTSYEFTTEYSSILAMVNDQLTTKGKKLPFSFVKVGYAVLTDVPSGWGGAEFTGIVYGNGPRLTVSIQAYGAIPDNTRDIFNGNWLNQWNSIDSEIAAINSNINTMNSKSMSGLQYIDTQIVTTLYINTLTKINKIKLLNIVGNVSLSNVNGWTNAASFPDGFLPENTIETTTFTTSGVGVSVQLSDGYVKFRPMSPISNQLIAFDLVYV